MLRIEIKIPRRFTNIFIHYFLTLSIIITGFLSPHVANGEITLLSPGINADDPVDENQAVTDKLTVFKWSSTSPQDSTSVYAIEMSFHKDFRNIDGGVVLDDTLFNTNITLSRNASRTIVNVAYDLSNDFNEPAGETLDLDLFEGIYWRVRLIVIGEPDELSPVFLTYYRYTQIQDSSTILGQVVSSDLNNALLTAANITIEAGDNSTSLLGNQPNNMISLSTDDDGRFLGFAVSLVDLSVTPPVIANTLPFPLKIIVRRAGFLDLTREIADRNQLEATCDIANPTNEGTCFILTPDSLPPTDPPPPPTDPTPLLEQTQVSQLYVSIFGRASEGEGNAYWQSEQSDMTVAANTMLNTEPAKAYFGDTLNDDQMFIEFIYKNTLGKDFAEDPEGVNYWVGELAAGKSKGQVVATLVSAAIDPQYAGLAAQDQFLNKVEVSNYTADNITTVPDVNDLSSFVAFISDVSDDAATVVAAKAAVDAF